MTQPSGNLRFTWAETGCQRADFIEVRLPETGTAISRTSELSKGHLRDAEIISWIEATPQYSTTTGGLRLLILDRCGYDTRLPLTQKTFDRLLEVFKLSDRTLESFDYGVGTFAKRYQFDEQGQLSGIDLIAKAPQSYLIYKSGPNLPTIGNWGLSAHYDRVSGVTTAVLYGANVIICTDEPTTPPLDTVLPNHPDLIKPEQSIDPVTNTWHQRAWPELTAAIEAKKCDLRHPLALATLLLQLHTQRAHHVLEHKFIHERTLRLTRKLLTGEAQHEYQTPWGTFIDVNKTYTDEGKELRAAARETTAEVSLHALRLRHSRRTLEWNNDCSKFLSAISEDLKQKLLDSDQPSIVRTATLGQYLTDDLEFNANICKALEGRVVEAQDHTAIHLELANALISQLSNETAVQIAKDNFRDSNSMKVIAAITTLFLPGAFVATLMSVGIWNWRWSPDDPQSGEPGVVSSRWWVYVAVTLPLTGITLGTWLVWWNWQIKQQEKVPFLKAFLPTRKASAQPEEKAVPV